MGEELLKSYLIKYPELTKLSKEEQYERIALLEEKIIKRPLEKYSLYTDLIELHNQEVNAILNPPHITKGLYKCKKCKSENTENVLIQVRSADEPMTNFIYCLKCRHQWREYN